MDGLDLEIVLTNFLDQPVDPLIDGLSQLVGIAIVGLSGCPAGLLVDKEHIA